MADVFDSLGELYPVRRLGLATTRLSLRSGSASLDPHRDVVRDNLGVREAHLEAVLARRERPPDGVGIVDELKRLAFDVPDDLLR